MKLQIAFAVAALGLAGAARASGVDLGTAQMRAEEGLTSVAAGAPEVTPTVPAYPADLARAQALAEEGRQGAGNVDVVTSFTLPASHDLGVAQAEGEIGHAL
jgi:hypothetical protein